MKTVDTYEEIVYKDGNGKLVFLEIKNGRYPRNLHKYKPIIKRKLNIKNENRKN